MSKRRVFVGLLVVAALVCAPATFIWARTMVYWCLSPSDSPMAHGAVIGQLIDSANNSESRSQYYPKDHSMIITPHCGEIEVPAPQHWTKSQLRSMEGIGMSREFTVSDFAYEAPEASNLRKRYSINEMALLAACMEATPFGDTCRNDVNEVRWDHQRSEQYLIKIGFLSKVNGEICIAYPEIKFKGQDKQ